MELADTIQQLRRDVQGVERDVAQLSMRLDAVEMHQRKLDTPSETTAVPESVAPTGTLRIQTPPPLPISAKTSMTETPPVENVKVDQAVTTARPVAPPLPREKPKYAPTPAAVAPPREPKVKKPRRFGPPEDMSFEMALGSYWAPRLGMLLLAMGAVWGFTYVAQKYEDSALMPYLRVGLGYLLSGGLVAVGRTLEKKYTSYARILLGGGLGITYFVTFATWYIPATRIAPSQEFTLALLALLVLGWGALAQWRKSQPIAFTMTLLGHFTVALSTLSLESPSRAAVGGLLLLGIGSAWFLIRNGWYAVAMTAMIGSYLNQFFWLSRSPGSESLVDFTVGMALLVAYLITYAAAELLTPPNRQTVPPRVRSIFVSLNTTGFVLLGIGLVRAFPAVAPQEHFLYFSTALFSLIMALGYHNRNAADRVTLTYFTKTSVLMAIGFATWLDGTTLTLSLALECLVLLYAARRRREHSGRILALGTAAVTFFHGIYVLQNVSFPAYGEAGFVGELFVALAIVVAFVTAAEMYRVTPWHTFPSPGLPKMPNLDAWCHTLEILPATWEGGPLPSRQQLSHTLALCGTFLLVGYSDVLLTPGSTILVLGVGFLALAGMALYRSAAPLLTTSVLLAAINGILTCIALERQEWVGTFALAVGGTATLVILAEAIAILVPRRFSAYATHEDIQGGWYRNHHLIATVCSAVAAGLIMLLASKRLAVEEAILLGGGLGLLGALYAAATASTNLGLLSIAMVLFAGGSCVVSDVAMFHPWMAPVGLALAAVAATAVESRWWGKRPGLAFHHLLPTPYLVYGAIAGGGLFLIDARYMAPALPVALAVFAVAFGVALPWLHRRAMAIFGTLLTLAACVAWVDGGTPASPDVWFHGTFLLLLATTLAGDRLLVHYRPFAQRLLGPVLLLTTWFAAFHYNQELTSSAWRYTGFAAMAVAFLGYAAWFRSRAAAFLSLLSAVVGTIPLLLFSFNHASPGVLCVAYVAMTGYWLISERGATRLLERTRVELLPGHQPTLNAFLTGIPALLIVVGLTKFNVIHDFYLTICWTVVALILFVWALVTRQPWFRYVGLCTVALAIGRAFLVDVWRLEGPYRVGALVFLGLALLTVAYGYTRWRATEIAEQVEEKRVEGEDAEPE